MSEHIRYAVSEGVGRITLARPEKKNAIDAAMYAALADAIGSAGRDGTVRALLIDAEGGAFTAGNDLADFQRERPDWHDTPVSSFLGALSEAELPVVAAVDGIAIGIGTTMLLHCDLVVASTTARFQMPFIDLGLVPEAASSLLLPRLVGHQRAAALLLLGDSVDAPTLQGYGLIHSVVAPDDLHATALGLARRLAGKPPDAMRQSKRLLRRAPEPVADRLAAEGAVFAERLRSAEAKAAFDSFFARRAGGR
ncbi:enoyl-CoA hydratase [Lichenibacterium minor]|uniref:Enoyl-CoA hydratase n=1 Tax=Lichenibacterium minor TaxID=2316528 RepID=A0A4Q2U4K0_9HYPH|nr:enoyl-CoA hydratase-related protein [Lichenibacterium minor]RYC29716.1 enoyl-CoA hydratase [Lichenibacterium minor]